MYFGVRRGFVFCRGRRKFANTSARTVSRSYGLFDVVNLLRGSVQDDETMLLQG